MAKVLKSSIDQLISPSFVIIGNYRIRGKILCSSSLLKEAAQGGGDIRVFVPESSAVALMKKLYRESNKPARVSPKRKRR